MTTILSTLTITLFTIITNFYNNFYNFKNLIIKDNRHLNNKNYILPLQTSDKKATINTKDLFTFLNAAQNNHTIIGHHDDLVYGKGWRFNQQNPKKYISDIYNSCGDFPGIFGWDLGQIERKVNNPKNSLLINNLLEKDVTAWAKRVHKSGGINCFTWHVDNPVTGGTSWDKGDGSNVCDVLQIGSNANSTFNKYLDVIANFFLSLKDEKNQLIPVIFRPFHEANLKNCFWWNEQDQASCNAYAYKNLFRYVHNYLTKTKNVHNLIYAFSLNDNCLAYNEEQQAIDIEQNYPGDDCVDIVGIDMYLRNEVSNSQQINLAIEHMKEHNKFITAFAQKRNKVAAITEFGWENFPFVEKAYTNFFTNAFANSKYSFILFWRNPDNIKDHTSFYSVYPDHPNATDFSTFYKTTNKYVFLSSLNHLRKHYN